MGNSQHVRHRFGTSHWTQTLLFQLCWTGNPRPHLLFTRKRQQVRSAGGILIGDGCRTAGGSSARTSVEAPPTARSVASQIRGSIQWTRRLPRGTFTLRPLEDLRLPRFMPCDLTFPKKASLRLPDFLREKPRWAERPTTTGDPSTCDALMTSHLTSIV